MVEEGGAKDGPGIFELGQLLPKPLKPHTSYSPKSLKLSPKPWAWNADTEALIILNP